MPLLARIPKHPLYQLTDIRGGKGAISISDVPFMDKVKFCLGIGRGREREKKLEEKDKKFSPHIWQITVGRKNISSLGLIIKEIWNPYQSIIPNYCHYLSQAVSSWGRTLERHCAHLSPLSPLTAAYHHAVVTHTAESSWNHPPAHTAPTTLLHPSLQTYQLWQILRASIYSSEYTWSLGRCHSCLRGLQQTTHSLFMERPGVPGHKHFSQEYQPPHAVLVAWSPMPLA